MAPIPLYQWASDFWWEACFSAVCVFTIRLPAKRTMWFFCGSIALILSRLALGSAGGGGIILELLLLIVMDVFAVKYLLKPERYIIFGDQGTTTDGHPVGVP